MGKKQTTTSKLGSNKNVAKAVKAKTKRRKRKNERKKRSLAKMQTQKPIRTNGAKIQATERRQQKKMGKKAATKSNSSYMKIKRQSQERFARRLHETTYIVCMWIGQHISCEIVLAHIHTDMHKTKSCACLNGTEQVTEALSEAHRKRLSVLTLYHRFWGGAHRVCIPIGSLVTFHYRHLSMYTNAFHTNRWW